MKKLLVLITGLFIGCQSNTDTQTTQVPSIPENFTPIAGIKAPSEKLKAAPTTLSIKKAESKGTYKIGPNVSLSIPENAFVDALGNPIKGNINLQLTEFRDAIDILLSGIPMEYDSANGDAVLQSAGMFNLEGFQNDESIFVAKGKQIQVKFNSVSNENNYNLYRFDTITQSWVYLNTCPTLTSSNSNSIPSANVSTPATESTSNNSTIQNNSTNEISKTTHEVQPQVYKKGEPVLDLEIDTKQFPNLQKCKTLVWQYAPEIPKADIENSTWIYDEKWTSINLAPEKDHFTIVLSNSSKKYSTKIIPVIDAKEMKSLEEQLKNTRAISQSNNSIESQDKLISGISQNTMRSFGITQFGIYNCDRIYREQALTINSSFTLPNKISPEVVYVVNASSNTVYKYTSDNFSGVKLLPEDDQLILSFLANGAIAGLKPEQIKAKLKSKPKQLSFELIEFPANQLSAASLKESANL